MRRTFQSGPAGVAWPARLAFCLAFAAACAAQPTVFQLQIPEIGDRLFEGDVIEVPGKHPSSILIRVLNPVAADVDYGRITTKLNGESAGFITSIANSADGKLARMNLALRAGMSLVPGANTVEVLAVNRRGRKYYKNFVIKTRDFARNEYFVYETKSVPGDDAGGAPDLLIVEPEFPIVLDTKQGTRTVRVKGSVSAAHPVDLVRIQKESLKSDQTTLDFEQQVSVGPSDTRITVEVMDRKGNRTAVLIPVVQPVVKRPVFTGGERYALLIGVSRYAKPGLPVRTTPGQDAEAFAGALQEHAGFKRENVLVITDAAATAAQITNALRNFVARPKSDDLLMVFFAGHGLHDPIDPEKIYLAAHDTQIGQLRETALLLDDLKASLAITLRARQALLLFDVANPAGVESLARGNNLVNEYLLRIVPSDAGRAVMVASGLNEAPRDTSPGNGAFIRYAMEGITGGKADWNQDGVLTAGEWFQYVTRSVRVSSGGAQNPKYALSGAGLALVSLNR